MENQSFITKLPEKSTAYVFGSFLYKESPNDIDILILYDPVICAPEKAYLIHNLFIENIKNLFGLPVDITLLTYMEEQRAGFIEKAQAVPIDEVICKMGRATTKPITNFSFYAVT
jgi:predicted nucleotidyltransferase